MADHRELIWFVNNETFWERLGTRAQLAGSKAARENGPTDD